MQVFVLVIITYPLLTRHLLVCQSCKGRNDGKERDRDTFKFKL